MDLFNHVNELYQPIPSNKSKGQHILPKRRLHHRLPTQHRVCWSDLAIWEESERLSLSWKTPVPWTHRGATVPFCKFFFFKIFEVKVTLNPYNNSFCILAPASRAERRNPIRIQRPECSGTSAQSGVPLGSWWIHAVQRLLWRRSVVL